MCQVGHEVLVDILRRLQFRILYLRDATCLLRLASRHAASRYLFAPLLPSTVSAPSFCTRLVCCAMSMQANNIVITGGNFNQNNYPSTASVIQVRFRTHAKKNKSFNVVQKLYEHRVAKDAFYNSEGRLEGVDLKTVNNIARRWMERLSSMSCCSQFSSRYLILRHSHESFSLYS